eukprot:278414-Rhodomonas_salina.1
MKRIFIIVPEYQGLSTHPRTAAGRHGPTKIVRKWWLVYPGTRGSEFLAHRPSRPGPAFVETDCFLPRIGG